MTLRGACLRTHDLPLSGGVRRVVHPLEAPSTQPAGATAWNTPAPQTRPRARRSSPCGGPPLSTTCGRRCCLSDTEPLGPCSPPPPRAREVPSPHTRTVHRYRHPNPKVPAPSLHPLAPEVQTLDQVGPGGSNRVRTSYLCCLQNGRRL